MFATVVITFVITAMGMSLLFVWDHCRKKDKDNQRLRNANDILNKQITGFHTRERQNREKDAYNRGLYDGRETDALYRGMLATYTNGEQATVILNGSGTTKRGVSR